MNHSLLLAILLLPTTILSASCSHSNSQVALWQAYTFNGVELVKERIEGLPSIWVRDGFSPRTEEPEKGTADTGRLPPRNGAVAGVCYIHTSGGKIADKSGFELLTDEQITIKNNRYGVSVIRSDAAGFFTEELYPDVYEFFCRGAKVEVIVREGKTVLTPIRGGKRMAD